MVMLFNVDNISHVASIVNGRQMPFFAETMPNSVSYMKSMGVTNIFLRLSLITLALEPSTKVSS